MSGERARWRNTAERYGIISAGFHWVIAVLVLGLLALGLIMTRLEPSPDMFRLYFWHKSIGATVLALAALRLSWKLSHTRPRAMPDHAMWERRLAALAHALLYFCLFAMPLSGWIMSSAKGFPVSVFGWFTLPDITGGEKPALSELAETVHEYTAWGLIGLIALHAAGALKHQFMDRDGTIRRMLPGTRSPDLPVLALVAALAGFLSVAPARAQDMPPDWIIDAEKSRLTFEGTQMGAPFTGTLPDFHGTIRFDPARPQDGRAEIVIPVAGAKTGSSDRDTYITLPEWLNAESFPESRYMVQKFSKLKDNQYVAHGLLTLRGVTLPVELPFTLNIAPGPSGRQVATAQGETMLKRLDYGIGEKGWKDTHTVGNPVIVRVFLVATRAE